jgi:hypothetical protein
MALTNSDYRELIRMVGRYIFKPHFALPPRNPYAESFPIYEITNYSYLEVMHAIFQALLLEPIYVATFIDRKFVTFLIDELDTPVAQEQALVESEVRRILEAFEDLESFIVNSLLSRTNEYRDGSRSPYCISPILRILLAHFDRTKNPKADEEYRRSFVPLYFTNFLTDFEKPLRTVTAHFSRKNPQNAEFAIMALLSHWPRTSPRKEISFLQQFSLLLQNCPKESLPKICPGVLKVLAVSLSSLNSTVVLNACFLLMDGQFLCLFESVRDCFALILIPALRKAGGHWKEDQRKMALELLETLGDDDAIVSEDGAKGREIWRELERVTGLFCK